MGQILVIAEKHLLATNYVKGLGGLLKKDGYYEGNGYIITWSIGHIIKRSSLSSYNEKFKHKEENWGYILNTLPFFPKEYKFEISDGSFGGDKASKFEKPEHRLKVIKGLLERPDIDFVVNGCDAGREGEAIFYFIYNYLHCKLPVKRLWISSNTASAVKKGFSELKDAKYYEGLKQAAYARSEADWEHGLNISAVFSSKCKAFLSLGRVQTPVLYMLVKREKEILNFVPEDYFIINGLFKTIDGSTYTGRLITDGKLKDLSKAVAIIKEVQNLKGKISDVRVEEKKEPPNLLYSLSDLEKDMSAKYKFPSKKTDSIAEKLYAEYKVLSYPRTESRCLTEDMRETIKERLDCLPEEFKKIASYAKNTGCFYDKVINDADVTDHYGLIPTEEAYKIKLSDLTEDERKEFIEICKRFLSLFLPFYEYESTSVTTNFGKYNFRTNGKKVKNIGWKILYKSGDDKKKKGKDSENEEQVLTHKFQIGEDAFPVKVEKISKKTAPPKRYTDGTLVEAMEHAGRNIENITDEEKLKEYRKIALGTAATRTGIIENILSESRNYAKRDGEYIIPTEKGMKLIELIQIPELKSPEMTGEWEHKLNLIAEGKYNKSDFKKEIQSFITECIEKIKTTEVAADSMETLNKSANLINAKCPWCHSPMRRAKNGYCCSEYPKCKFGINSEIFGKKITEKDVIDICSGSRTRLIKGFKMKKKEGEDAGKGAEKEEVFDAYVYYSIKEKKLKFDSNNHKTTAYKCPLCGAYLIEHSWGLGCSNYSRKTDPCKYSLSKNIHGVTLTKSDFDKLFSGQATRTISNFISTDRKDEGEKNKGIKNKSEKNKAETFSAKLKLQNGIPKFLYQK